MVAAKCAFRADMGNGATPIRSVATIRFPLAIAGTSGGLAVGWLSYPIILTLKDSPGSQIKRLSKF